MTNKELQECLKAFPDDMDVLIDRNGVCFSECAKPIKKFMGTSQKEYIVLYSKFKVV